MEVFLLVTRLGNFSDAARSLRITPSALSRSVAQLEAALGVRLFERSTGSVVLTAEGGEFVLTARRVLDELDRGLDDFQQYVGAQRGRVTHPKMVRQVCLLAKISRPQSPLGRAFAAFLHREVRGGLLDGKFGEFAWPCQGKKTAANT